MIHPIRWLFPAVLVVVLGYAGAPGASQSLLTAEERAWLEEHGPIRVGVFNDYPPVGYLDESGHPQGMSIDFWRLIARNLDVDVTFKACAFQEQLDGLTSGRFDSLAGIFSMEERKDRYAFTSPYFRLCTSIYTRPDLSQVTGWDTLQGLRVGVVAGDSGQTLAKNAGLSPKAFPTYREVVLGLLHKTLDAIVLDDLVVGFYTASYNARDRIRKAGDPVDQGSLCLPVRKGNPMLLSILDKGVQSVSQEDWAMIEMEWLEPKEM